MGATLSSDAAGDAARDEDASLAAQLRRDGPMNAARALEIMQRFGLDGFVLGEPVNVYHVLGYWPQLANTRAGQPPTTFALLARDPRQPPGLVTSQFVHYYTIADGGFERDLQVHLYREAADVAGDADARHVDGAVEPAKAGFPDRGLAPPSAVERRRRDALVEATRRRGSWADAGAALVRAMRDMGLWHGRVGFDHAVVAAVCARHERPGELVDADPALRWIRLVKSPLELRLMRRAAQANADAIATVAHGIRDGASHAELQAAFAVEAARRGNRAVFLNVDRVSSELSDGIVREGQAFFLDGVSAYRHYHGDFARTVFLGEPAPAARNAARAAAFAWNAIRETLRPGLRYSQIAATGREALRRGGFDVTVGFGPHSVGLMHTDEPGEDAGGFQRKLDLVLEPGMILSVDCPVMDTGIGGSAHIEDLMRITVDGAEPLHAPGEPVIVL